MEKIFFIKIDPPKFISRCTEMRPYSKDLRARAVQAVKRGVSRKEVAELYQVSPASIKRYLRLGREFGDPINRASVRNRRTMIKDKAKLQRMIENNPDARIKEFCKYWQDEEKELVSIPTMWRALSGLGWKPRKGHSKSKGKL
jgi:transposase